MSQCKKKAGSIELIDRLSDLPSNVIDVILQRLPIQDLVKTSVLSKKWRHVWTSVTGLRFTKLFFEKCKHLDYLETSSIITDVLFLQNGMLHEFYLHIPSHYRIKMECLSKWILFLSRKGVKQLVLAYPRTNPYRTPSHIFSCQELTYLHLQNSELSTVPNFRGFKNLAVLQLFHVTFESGALESLMSGCYLLKVLTISYCSGIEHVNVSSPVLKYLRMESEEVIKSICLKKAQNLIDLTLCADQGGDNIEGCWVSDMMKDLPKIESLYLGGGYIEILSAINPRVLLKSADTLTHLKLSGVNFKEGELSFIISLLESSPNLEELDIESDSTDVGPQMVPEEFDCNDCCFSQLQTVKITVNTVYEHALNLIRFVLAMSSSLKILTFRVGLGLNQSDAPILLSISRDMLQMKRASVGAEVKFLYDGLIE